MSKNDASFIIWALMLIIMLALIKSILEMLYQQDTITFYLGLYVLCGVIIPFTEGMVLVLEPRKVSRYEEWFVLFFGWWWMVPLWIIITIYERITRKDEVKEEKL